MTTDLLTLLPILVETQISLFCADIGCGFALELMKTPLSD